MIEKLTFSVLVDNQSGVLQRVASLFSRRGYNINSLTVSETEDPAFSRMTVVSEADQDMARQIEMPLLKLRSTENTAQESWMLRWKVSHWNLRADRIRSMSLSAPFPISESLKWQEQVKPRWKEVRNPFPKIFNAIGLRRAFI